MISESTVVWNIEPRDSSSSRSWAALVRFPLCAIAIWPRLQSIVSGWAFRSSDEPVSVFVVLRDRTNGTMLRAEVTSDPRRWNPGESTVFEARIVAPPGAYDVLLHLPDAAESLRDRPEYAVRFANPGVWEASGMNRLAETVTVGR